MRIHIDWTACDARGACVELLPEVLSQDPWGYPIPIDGSRQPTVPPEAEEYARRAATHCPRLALHVLRSTAS